jgi:hypothetical protein
MFRGDWLKSEKGVRLATTERMLVGVSSMCVVMPGTMSSLRQAMSMYTCSKGPTLSLPPVSMCSTGRIMRAGVEKRYKPGYCPPREMGTKPISRSRGTWWVP